MQDLEEREGGGIRRRGSREQEEYYEPMQRQASSSKYSEVLSTLDRFSFSDDPDRRKRQMNMIVSAVRNALQDVVLDEVASNTKTAYKGYAERVVKAPGGLKCYFNFSGKGFTVIAKGTFYGDETVCVHQEGGKVGAAVLRIEGDNHTDLSSNFEVTVASYTPTPKEE